jgi:tripartite-type tricarboxylate transporter receptor subunit TctC
MKQKMLAVFVVLIAHLLAFQSAQAFPDRPIKLVVASPAGGPPDVMARLLSDKMAAILGQPVIVEAKPGAGGNLAADAVAKSTPDGYTIGLVTGAHAISGALYKQLAYSPTDSFDMLSTMVYYALVIAVRADHKAKTLADLIAIAKAKPDDLSYGSVGFGSTHHLAGELLNITAGTRMVHVPYRGSAQAIQDLMGGRVDLIFDNITSALPQAKAGAIRGLGVTTAKRAPTAPEFPPIADTVPGFDVSSWFALFAPARTPAAIIAKIQADTKAGIADPALRTKMDALAAEPGGWTQEELASFLRSELTKWGDLIKEVGIKAD